MNRYLITATAIALAILAFLALRPDPADAPTDPTPCHMIAPDIDHSFGAFPAYIDYEGSSTAIWRDTRNGEVIGYSVEEDAIVYATLDDARHCPTYMN